MRNSKDLQYGGADIWAAYAVPADQCSRPGGPLQTSRFDGTYRLTIADKRIFGSLIPPDDENWSALPGRVGHHSPGSEDPGVCVWNPQWDPGRMDVLQPQGTWKADQAALLNVWTARLTRSVRGTSVCSVNLIEASAICFVPAIAVSIAVFVKRVCRSIASLSDFTRLNTLKVETHVAEAVSASPLEAIAVRQGC